MHRFYLPPQECRADHLALSGSEAHHAADVLRVKAGDPVAVLDGAGGELACRVETVSRQKVEMEVQGRTTEPPPPWQITLVQAIPKGKLFEAIIQKATELGVGRVVPLLSQRVTTHLEGGSIQAKAGKWRQTAVEAIKQCGQRWLPRRNIRFDSGGVAAGRQSPSARLFSRRRTAAPDRLRLDRPRRRFRPGRNGGDPRRGSVADDLGPAGVAQRDGRAVRALHPQLRTAFSVFVAQVSPDSESGETCATIRLRYERNAVRRVCWTQRVLSAGGGALSLGSWAESSATTPAHFESPARL